jgi:plasmid maintenance system antidote protein VapI
MKNTGMMSFHQGEFIKRQVLEPLDLTISPAAEIPGRRNADLTRFTIDRLIKILNKLDQQVNVHIKVQPR